MMYPGILKLAGKPIFFRFVPVPVEYPLIKYFYLENRKQKCWHGSMSTQDHTAND